jgi:long-chain acyl-CoA synthetase
MSLTQGLNRAAAIHPSGTATKGVMLTHRNLVANAAMAVPAFGYRFDSIYVHAGPMFHIADGASIFAITMVGGVHVFIPRFDPADLLAAVARHSATNTLLVPTMIGALANFPRLAEYDVSSLRLIPNGGSPMPDATRKRATVALPTVHFLHVYGMTEAAPLVTAMDLGIEVDGERLKSCGRPALLVDVRIADPDDYEVPRGTSARCKCAAPTSCRDIGTCPTLPARRCAAAGTTPATAATWDADGYVYIVDRLKDMMISGGENVYSAEVESAISILDGVTEVAVIGIPDDRWGEAHAVVVPVAGRTLTAEQVIGHCRSLIAGYKSPRSVEIRDNPLPLSGAGKVLKAQLREPFWSGRDQRIS